MEKPIIIFPDSLCLRTDLNLLSNDESKALDLLASRFFPKAGFEFRPYGRDEEKLKSRRFKAFVCSPEN